MAFLRVLPDVVVSEVGPRDGLQSISAIMPLDAKTAWVDALAEAGLREIEVGSFVSAKLLPQMADTGDVVRHARRIPRLEVITLVANMRGAQAAIESGASRVTVPVSASARHSQANVNRTPEQMVETVAEMARLFAATKDAPELEVGISTAFGCTLEGPVAEDRVISLAVALAQAGVRSVGLSDTTGYGTPSQVRRLFRRLQAELGDKAGGAHFHNTRGQGLANVVAALEVGVRTFDSSQAGLGGCPYAPGATGNIVTEDLVFLLESEGLDTGIDIEKLRLAREVLRRALPGEALYGHVLDAGLPKGFTYAAGLTA